MKRTILQHAAHKPDSTEAIKRSNFQRKGAKNKKTRKEIEKGRSPIS